jgi:cytochrome bd-type quinol oxidase subunit 2
VPIDHGKRQISYGVLCATPFIAFGAAAARPLRIPGVYHVIGGVLFAAISSAAWTLGARAVRADVQSRRQLALAGTLLLTPFAMVALLWVGIGAPPAASAAENQMRYLLLIAMALATTCGFVVLKEALSQAGQRLQSSLGFAAIMLACSLYLVWDAFVFGAYFGQEHTGSMPPAFVELRPFRSLVLSVAGSLTYLATAAFAASLARARWLGRRASLAYIIVSFIALFFIVITILARPDPAATSQPWYTALGFVLGVPALPLIMPALMGVVLLRRAGDEPR